MSNPSARDTEEAAERGEWQQVKALFETLEALPADERERRLHALGAGHTELLAQVRTLLRSHDALPATGDDRVAAGVGRALDGLWPEVEPGRRFGAFVVTAEIGRGGMGAVYRAERADGTVTQRVALKVVARAGLDAQASLRLAQERRVLAALEHPNIARLIDAGEDDSGVPYFAMEYVDGVALTAYCDQRALPLPDRLRLFRQVCAAVQYAHANLVVHCDLKAANILVGESGVPKLLDFGIATSLGEDRRSGPHSTFLSPHAAAPEQFRHEPCSVATDVHALGVLLCELVCGTRPYGSERASFAEIEREVLNDPPRLPSRHVSAASAAQRGALRASALQARLRGDLDAIVARALQKEPRLRYASVDHLDRDIALHLDLRPISVRRAQPAYRAAKFIRRNALSTVLGVLLVAIVVGFIVSIGLKNRQLAQERDQAQRREQEAQFERARAQRVADFLVGLFQSTEPERARSPAVSAVELLQRGQRLLETSLRDEPSMRATLLATIGDAYFALDDLDAAERLALAASSLREAAQPPVAAERAGSLRQLARLANQRGRYAEALEKVGRANALDSSPPADDRAAALAIEATALEGLARPQEAVALRRQGLQICERLYGETDVRTLRAAMRLAFALRAAGEVDEAARIMSENLPRSRFTLPGDEVLLGEASLDLAIFAREHGDPAKARPLADDGLAIYRRIYGDTSSQAAAAMNTLATIEQAAGDYGRARALFEQVLTIKRAVFGAASPQAAAAEYNVGLLLLLRLHDARAAEAHLREAVEIAAKVLPATHANLAGYRLGLGSALRDLHRDAAAADVLNEALRGFEANKAPRGINLALARGELACLRPAGSRDPAAVAQLDQALETLDRFLPQDPQAERLRECRKGR